MFHDFPEDLHSTAIMCAVQESTATIQKNNNSMYRQSNARQQRDNLVKREVLEKATDEFIQFLIHIQMWDSRRLWNTAGEVKKEVRYLKLKRDKDSGLKYNIQIHYKGLGKVEAITTWSNNGKNKTIP